MQGKEKEKQHGRVVVGSGWMDGMGEGRQSQNEHGTAKADVTGLCGSLGRGYGHSSIERRSDK